MSFDAEAQERPRKRIKKEPKTLSSDYENRRLFAPFRALGFVSNHVPFAMQVRTYKGATTAPRVHILTCLGRAWAELEGEKMRLLFVGPDAHEPISALSLHGNYVWATAGPEVLQYETGKQVAVFSNPQSTPLSALLNFGNQVLALTEDGHYLHAWDVETGNLDTSIVFDDGFTATHVIHPATMLNKVLVASAEGSMQLWNLRTRTLLHQFNSQKLCDAAVNSPCAITALVQSHVTDVVGVAFSNGEASIYDIRQDERLFRVRMDGGAIRALSFRTDGEEVLATANANGNIALWDLNSKARLLHIIRGAHNGPVTGLQWIPSQPIVVSSGEDNSVKQWICDSLHSPPRLLKFRSGHHAPPHLIRYYGTDGKQLITASRDRSIRITSVVRDSRSFELSQGAGLSKKAARQGLPQVEELKLPPVMCLDWSTNRSKEWDDVLTGGQEETVARTWSVLNKRIGKYAFSTVPPEPPKPTKGKAKAAMFLPGIVKSVCITACGNFSFVGSSTGSIQMWNLQSGIRRKTFDVGPVPDEVDWSWKEKGRGRGISGLVSDSLNKWLVAGTVDGTLNFFDFHTTTLQETLILPSSVVSMQLQRDSNLLAVVSDNFFVQLFDIETRRLVRELSGFSARVLDVTFSPDSRWLIATSLDSTIRTFDIPTGRLLDGFRCSSVAASVAFSPSGDFLATSHVDSVGVYLWANRAQYAEVSFRSTAEIERELTVGVSLPSVQGTAEEEELAALASCVPDPTSVFSTPAQLDTELITLTLLPRARWQTLLNLDIISQRNKPKEPPKAPAKAPFFLPSLPGDSLRFDLTPTPDPSEGKAQKKANRLEKNRALQAESEFMRLLRAEDQAGDYELFFAHLKSLTPPAIDLELRTSLVLPSAQLLFIHALTQRLRSHKDFEAVQALIAVFLRPYGEIVIGEGDDGKGKKALEDLLEVQRAEAGRVMRMVTASLGTLSFVRETL